MSIIRKHQAGIGNMNVYGRMTAGDSDTIFGISKSKLGNFSSMFFSREEFRKLFRITGSRVRNALERNPVIKAAFTPSIGNSAITQLNKLGHRLRVKLNQKAQKNYRENPKSTPYRGGTRFEKRPRHIYNLFYDHDNMATSVNYQDSTLPFAKNGRWFPVVNPYFRQYYDVVRKLVNFVYRTNHIHLVGRAFLYRGCKYAHDPLV